jgi:polyferredoxin
MEKQSPIYHIVRWRTALYVAVIAIVGSIMVFTFATRHAEGLTVIHDRNPIFVRLSNGALRNAYALHILNKSHETRTFSLLIEGLPGADVSIVGDTVTSGVPIIVVGPDQTREFRVLVTAQKSIPPAASLPVKFIVSDYETGIRAIATDYFNGP